MSAVRVCIEHLEPGMVLMNNVPGVDGSVLLARGAALTGEAIAMLADLGIASVSVRSESIQDAAHWEERVCLEYVRRFFVYVNPDEEFFVELFRSTFERVLTAFRNGFALRCADEIQARSVEHMTDVFFRNDLTLDKLVLHETQLASFPDIYFKLKQVIEAPNSSAKEIAQVVGSDVGLAGRLLKLVNSPFYGLSSRVDSIERAVSMVGARELSTLALGITTINFFKDIPPELVDMRTFWRHSLSCAVFCKLLADYGALPRERMFIAGLLHDAGRLLLFKDLPYASVQAMIHARSNMLPLLEAEIEIFGFNHAHVGQRLLSEWKFPEAIVAAVGHHHDPQGATIPAEAAAVQLADILANAAEISAGGTYVVPGCDHEAIAQTRLPIRDVRRILAAHDAAIDELVKALL